VKTYSIPADLLQAVANYLMGRPWAEVNQMIVRLQQEAKPIEQPQPPEAE
jgi:hypothetical protein